MRDYSDSGSLTHDDWEGKIISKSRQTSEKQTEREIIMARVSEHYSILSGCVGMHNHMKLESKCTWT